MTNAVCSRCIEQGFRHAKDVLLAIDEIDLGQCKEVVGVKLALYLQGSLVHLQVLQYEAILTPRPNTNEL